ncbi:hypothetical protein LCGC14_2540740, partial [marine sediment metagenome]
GGAAGNYLAANFADKNIAIVQDKTAYGKGLADETKKAIQKIVDMPDRQIDLFIRFCLQNNGRLSAQKRTSHFDFLLNEEVDQMEKAVQSAYGDLVL